MLKINEMYCGDVVDIVKQLDDNSIDLVICDAMYGNKYYVDNEYEYTLELQKTVILMCDRVLKPGGMLIVIGKQRIVLIDPEQNGEKLTSDTIRPTSKLYWIQKENIEIEEDPHNLDSYLLNQVLFYSKGKKASTFNIKDLDNQSDTWNDIEDIRLRPTELIDTSLSDIQKPIQLIERLIKLGSNKGDLVLDLYGNVGTVPLVCKQLERKYIMIEPESELFEFAKKRIKNY